MKIILATDVETLGHKGEVVTVADGYARNFLVPKGMALVASKGALKQAEQMRRAREEALRKAKDEAVSKVALLGSSPGGGQAVRVGHQERHRARDSGPARAGCRCASGAP
jgi:uncharacterized protein YbbK (DUF523 family)